MSRTKNQELRIKNFFIIVFLIFLLLPQSSWAVREYQADSETIYYDGLVPCGKDVCKGGDPEEIERLMKEENKTFQQACEESTGEVIESLACQFCHFFVMLDAILDFVITMAFIIAVLMIVIAGVMFIFAYLGGIEVLPGGGKGGPKLLSQAKKTLNSVVTGLIIIFAAWVIVYTIFVFLGVAQWAREFTGPEKWFQINCPIELPQ